MDWERLLSTARLGQTRKTPKEGRTDFNTDHDRIVFSSAFRRLQDKTQVFPLAETDYVRTRLTHSLEASNIGRTLGTLAGRRILARLRGDNTNECTEDSGHGTAGSPSRRLADGTADGAGVNASLAGSSGSFATDRHGLSGDNGPSGHNGLHSLTEDDFGAVVATAALAHDMGNPPFGHSGEDAIREWFLSHPTGQEIIGQLPEACRADLLYFEGNAQGFRILNRLQFPDRAYGMRLTCAVLGAFMKYPCDASVMDSGQNAGGRYTKFGLFRAEKDSFAQAAEELGLIALRPDGSRCTGPDGTGQTPLAAWARHPLAYLVEAADDICYSIADVEDGFRRGRVTYDEVRDLLCPLIAPENNWWERSLEAMRQPTEQVEFLRAVAMGGVVRSAVDCFMEHEDALLRGEHLKKGLTRHMALATPFARLGEVNYAKVYQDPQVVEIEAAGYEVMDRLLTAFGGAVFRRYNGRMTTRDTTVVKLFPAIRHAAQDSLYEHMLEVTDFVSGMTDTSAVSLYKKLSGMTLGRG
ncbi:hypothetical protein DSM19430T_11110 [Desulfovibrio psychrotolerans]|uniref:HD/PDEase domain-containing protein n=2 Tax=Desulfovibrio psychrotolerans TaxID=415242 RepID=A0A7J0BRV0_9BACT|nr:hypothetical protein DSM19430T_11110 [Desulfovibrio psychrotolerans]